MKRIIGLVCIFLALIAGCKKDNTQKNADISSSLAGKWELRQSSAAIRPLISNYLPGNGSIIQFTKTDYVMSVNGKVTKRGRYIIVPDSTVQEIVCLIFPSGQFENRIVYDNNSSQKVFVQVSNNRLTFISGCYAYDAGYSSEYDRLMDKDY